MQWNSLIIDRITFEVEFRFISSIDNEGKINDGKLSIKITLLLMLKPMFFSNRFDMIFILKLNLPSSCIIRFES